MSLSRDDVQKVSLLARLRLSDEELDTLTSQMGRVLQYIEQLGELDTDAVEPMAHAVDVANVFRDDAVRPSHDRGEILANCPRHDDEFYLVPPVLGD